MGRQEMIQDEYDQNEMVVINSSQQMQRSQPTLQQMTSGDHNTILVDGALQSNNTIERSIGDVDSQIANIQVPSQMNLPLNKD